MDRTSKLLAILFLIVVLASITLTIHRTMIVRNYPIEGQEATLDAVE